jgi:hypothetical protein
MIEYNNKKIKLPFVVKSHSTAMVKRTNRLSGQSIDLPGFAACVFDYIMYMTEVTEAKDRQTNQPLGFSDNQDDWQIVRNGLDWFKQHFAKEYMVLLD